MTLNGILQIVFYFVVILLLTKPLGTYMARVFQGERTPLTPILRPVELLFYKLFGVKEDQDMKWTTYGFAMLMFSVVGGLMTYALLRLQGHLPFNPQHVTGDNMTPDLSFNTAWSFTTNTNWQNYVPEQTISYFSNMVALAAHNWMSVATGIAVAIAVVRGFARRSANGVGNFWVDATRTILYICLPICFVYALFLVWQGVPQNFAPYTSAKTLESQTQTIAQGPIASQEAIKMLGTNGGGFFNANSAHPYENPTPLSNLIEMLSLLCIGAALTYTFGKMVGNVKQGWAIFAAMSVMFIGGVFVCYGSEARGNPNVAKLGVMTAANAGQPGGNMEGKEVRFGIANSALFASVTTDASCGAVNAMHDSLTPLGGLVPLFNMQLGEVIVGGGAGLYGMLLFAIIAVFVAGLMVGRTPEYLGKKIEAKEVKMAMLAILILPLSILGFTAIAVAVGPGLAGISNAGPHGFSEVLYAYTSATGNNGSAFAGLSANSLFYNVTIGLAMLIGRFMMIVPMMAVAGSLGVKKIVPASAGTFPTNGPLFVGLLTGVILIVGGLTYFPAVALGPIVEQLAMNSGKLY